MYVVELENNCWLAPWSGDPGRTIVSQNARVFGSRHGARVALGFARKHRPFPNARVLKHHPLVGCVCVGDECFPQGA
jgi:hypothetical protein